MRKKSRNKYHDDVIQCITKDILLYNMNHNAHWTEEEKNVIRQYYPKHGPDYCLTLLPGRVRMGVIRQAQTLGVKKNRGVGHCGVSREEIIALYHELREIKQVAKKIGVSPASLQRWFRINGIEKVTNRRIDRIKQELAADYMANVLTIQQIAIKYGVGITSIVRAIKRWGLVNPDRWIISRSGINSVNARRRGKTTHELWTAKHGKEEADRLDAEYRRRKSEQMTGKHNHMYGQPTPRGAGNGWKGWYKGHYFRSLREAMFMIQADADNKEWLTGESKEFVVRYVFDGKERTYRPDFVMEGIVYELKPKRLHKSRETLAKQEAALGCFNAKGLQYVLTDIEVNSEALRKAYEQDHIKMDDRYKERFAEYISST